MSDNNNYFDGVIGQPRAKKTLSFFLDNHRKNKTAFPHILFTGSKGDGKTHLARKVGRNLPDFSDPAKRHKDFFIKNGTELKNPRYLLEECLSQFANNQDYATFFVDEAHEMSKQVQTMFLSILEPNAREKTEIEYDDITYTFDFRKVTFMFATTEDDKMFHALMDRLRVLSLEPYEEKELAAIIELVIDGRVRFEDDMLKKISRYVRRNARKADCVAKDILSLGVPVFTKEHFDDLLDKVSLYPYGLTLDEVRALEILEANGELSLGVFASRLGRPPRAMQKGVEPYILALGLMEIDGKRRLTAKGRNYLRELRGEKTIDKASKLD